ncbi:MAG: FemAB family XrtA/PEP-CTERM system-associated protein [Pseudomonadota bacterium]
MSVKVKYLEDSHAEAWDAYVARHKHGTFFHLSGWRSVLERAFGHKGHCLFAEQGDDIVGVLPLVQVKSLLFGNSLSSMPFCVYGGIVADDDAAALALRRSACELAERLQVDALELRNRERSDSGWPVKELYYTFRKDIDADEEANLKAIPNRQRAMVRKGIKEGLQSDWYDGVHRMYEVYAESVRNLGTPVFSRRYMDILRQEFGDACSVLMITHEGRDVAGVLNFYFRDEVIPYYGGSTGFSRSLKGVNHFMYWELMRRSAEQGYRVFDFGRSKSGTGPFSFKKNFGFEPVALPYEYYLVRSSQVPDVNPLNPKYRAMVNTWSRLPLPLANRLGPLLARSLG